MTLMPAFDPYKAALQQSLATFAAPLTKASRQGDEPRNVYTIGGVAYVAEKHPAHGLVFRKVA